MTELHGRPAKRAATRVGVIGFGAIGAPVIEALRDGRIPGCNLSGILTRSTPPDELERFAASSLHDLIDRSDLIVEAAGHKALGRTGPSVIESGTDLLVLSVGALVDDLLYQRLTRDGGGRLLISTGAVGGLDTLLAAMLVAPLDSVSLISKKPSEFLVRPWMSEELQEDAFLRRSRDRSLYGAGSQGRQTVPRVCQHRGHSCSSHRRL